MAKSPAQRFANAEQMLQALNKIERVDGNGLPGRVRQFVDRAVATIGEKKRVVLFALAAVLLLATGLYAADTWFDESDDTVASTTKSAPAQDTAPEQDATQPPAAAASDAQPTDSTTSDSTPASAQTTTSSEATKPASDPGKTPTQQAAKPKPAPTTSKTPKPVRKIKGWFSRLFRRR